MPLPKRITDFESVKELVLQIERDLLAQTRLKALAAAAGVTLAGHREDLRGVKLRIARKRRGRRKPPR